MKRKLGLIVAAVCLAASLAAFAACATTDGPESGDGVDYGLAVVFKASSDVMDITESSTMKDYMDALVEDGRLTYEGGESIYGYYISSVCGVAEQTYYGDGYSYGMSWSVYTDYATDDDGVIYATDYQTFDYNGKELWYASYGVSTLPCVEGCTYALVYEAWSYSY